MATKKIGAFQTKILKRFMNDKEYDALFDSYKEACWRQRGARDLNALDRKIFSEYRGGGRYIGNLREVQKVSNLRSVFDRVIS